MRLPLVFGTLLLLPCRGIAQSQSDSLIPKELAVALLSSGYDRGLLVGVPARGFPAELLVSSASLLGSLHATQR